MVDIVHPPHHHRHDPHQEGGMYMFSMPGNIKIFIMDLITSKYGEYDMIFMIKTMKRG